MTRRITITGKPVQRRGLDGRFESGYIDSYTGEFVPGKGYEQPIPRQARDRTRDQAVDELMGMMLMARVMSTENGRAAFTPGGIERQEAQEQQRMLATSRLPKDLKYYGNNCNFNGDGKWALLYEHMGIVKRDAIDDLFYAVTLPEDWEIKASDHSMWSYLYDQWGRQRASIFYKGAFYDRKADWSLDNRFYTSHVYDTPTGEYPTQGEEDVRYTYGVWDRATGDILFRGEYYSRKDRDWAFQDVQQKAASDWLYENYPEWQDPFAYWYWF